MATYHRYLILLMMSRILSTSVAESFSTKDDLVVAIKEMQKANHFSFVMLLNMLLSDKLPENITFLMPNDRLLSNISMPEHEIAEFIQRHSIPSPLLLDQMKHFPTGSMIPTSKPNFMLKISNNGNRRSFYLNDILIISPDICTAGFSIRCHGINGVLLSTEPEQNGTALPPSSHCVTSPNSAPGAEPSPTQSSPLEDSQDLVPAIAPSPNHTGFHTSESSRALVVLLLHSVMTCMILSLVYY
ncbi:FAS1 domain-containing protein SELMODRAFT_448915-like [Papaver somniferum]|uniref:FAS1 domain-containing protein SELMODRAFT_448915-like n=1 Tax=Papaver somniferum TaxID=3469 RepID=UPI000E70451A|nr:FAS1 domain-containing protein SELMODRAFT_448915-like [Papaver somniferum]